MFITSYTYRTFFSDCECKLFIEKEHKYLTATQIRISHIPQEQGLLVIQLVGIGVETEKEGKLLVFLLAVCMLWSAMMTNNYNITSALQKDSSYPGSK